MKVHQPTSADLRKMDDLLLDIKSEGFHLAICIRDEGHEVEEKGRILDEILNKKQSLMDQLEKLVSDWSYVPLSAACYRNEIPITMHKSAPKELVKMDDYITRIRYEMHQIKRYKREDKGDAHTFLEIADAMKTKKKLTHELRNLIKTWDYVPMDAADLLEMLILE